MITEKMKDKGFECKGQGFNCYRCKDKNECIDYVEVETKENKVNNNLFIKIKDVKIFDIGELNDKTLKINVIEGKNRILVAGICSETGKTYIMFDISK